MNDKYIEAYLGRASAKEILKDYMGAINDYNEVIKIDSQRVDAYWLRAHVKQNLKDHTGAKDDYLMLLEVSIDSKTKGKYYYRALAKREIGDYHGAIKELDDNILLLIYDGYDPGYCHYLLGIWKIEIGQKEEGCRDLSRAGEYGYKKAYETIKKYCN